MNAQTGQGASPSIHITEITVTRPRRCTLTWLWCLMFGFVAPGAEWVGADGPLVFDQETGHYQDLSYEMLTDQGLSWEERAKLFGGETVYYGELTDDARVVKRAELNELLRRMAIAARMRTGQVSANLGGQVERAIRSWLDTQRDQSPPAYAGGDAEKLRDAAVRFWRAYEILGNQQDLAAGLTCADRILAKQFPRGHWASGNKGADIMRIQDGFVTRPFWIMLYAHKVSGDKKYLSSARRAVDALLAVQSAAGGWPDYWSARGGRGLETVGGGSNHLDSWDVLGEWGMASHEMENYFAVPVRDP